MIAFALRRALQAIGVMLAVGVIAFSMFRFAGDPVSQIVSIDTPAAERAREARTAAEAALAEVRAQLEAVKGQVQPAQELAERMLEEAKAAEAARVAAVEEAREAQRKLAPISVLISRNTQRLYVRQAREPLFDTAVTIADADSPLGTYVFTAVAYAKAETELRWNLTPRWALIGFVGAGRTWGERSDFGDAQSQVAKGTGVRYLIARMLRLYVGADYAWGPEDETLYFQVGSAWR